VVDSPVAAPAGLKVIRDAPGAGATPSQVKAIYAIARSQPAMGDSGVERRCRAVYGRLPAELTRRQASEFIDALRRSSAAPPAAPSGSAPVTAVAAP
jgi:hypothetical protein